MLQNNGKKCCSVKQKQQQKLKIAIFFQMLITIHRQSSVKLKLVAYLWSTPKRDDIERKINIIFHCDSKRRKKLF